MNNKIEIKRIDTRDRISVYRFIRFSHFLYNKCPYWVPPIDKDVFIQLNKNKYPFYEHSDADFFIALRNNRIVGRIAAIESKRYNNYYKTYTANFYFFDCEEDRLIVNKLFEAVFSWAEKRKLNTIMANKWQRLQPRCQKIS